MKVNILKLDKTNNPRIKSLARIKPENAGKKAGITIIQGNHNIYCIPPNQSYKEDGLRKWMNIITFEQALWRKIQKKILKRYEDLENERTN